MKKTTLLFTFLFGFSVSTFAQILKPAKWSYKASKEKPQVGETISIIFTATIDPEWYLYSSQLSVDGPMPTTVNFTNNGSFQAIGELQAMNPKEKFDDVWEGKIHYFVKTGIFIQKVKILKANPTIEGKLSYQTCTLKDGSCVPNKDKFSISL